MLNDTIMNMSTLLQYDPCLLIQKFINTQKIAELYDRDDEAEAHVSHIIYSQLHSKHKQIGNQSLFAYRIPKSSVLNAIVEFTTKMGNYAYEKRTLVDYLGEEQPLPNEVADDRQEQIQYAGQLWHDVEIQCRRV